VDHNSFAKEIINGIIGDITMRSRLGDIWEDIDGETKINIKKEWESIIIKELEYRLI